MILDIVGCRAGLPAANEPCSSYLVSSGKTRLLVDVGPGAFARLPDAREVDAVLVTHAHPDHLLDAALLGYARHLDGAPRIPLHTTARAWWLLTELQPLCADVFEFRPMADGRSHALGDLEVTYSRVPHGPEEAYAVRLDDGRSRLLYSGDCGPGPALVSAARSADVLLVEASWGISPSLGAHHLTVRQACEAAVAAGVADVVLTHLDPAAPRAEVRAVAASCGLSARIARPGQRLEL